MAKHVRCRSCGAQRRVGERFCCACGAITDRGALRTVIPVVASILVVALLITAVLLALHYDRERELAGMSPSERRAYLQHMEELEREEAEPEVAYDDE